MTAARWSSSQELLENVPAIVNAVGRIHRLGQPSPQDIMILTLASSRSYDDFMLARAFSKYSVEICGKRGFVDLSKDLNMLWRSSRRLERKRGVKLGQALAGELIRRKLGMQWNRLGNIVLSWIRMVPEGADEPRTAITLEAYAGGEYEMVTQCGKTAYDWIVNGGNEPGGEGADAQDQAQEEDAQGAGGGEEVDVEDQEEVPNMDVDSAHQPGSDDFEREENRSDAEELSEEEKLDG